MLKRITTGLGALALLVGGLTAVTAPAVASPTPVAPQAATSVLTPPALLPWGDKPVMASASVVKAAVVREAKSQPFLRAPKGNPSTAQTKPATVAKATMGCGVGGTDACFYYNLGKQTFASPGVEGLYSTAIVAKPFLATADYHTLQEIAVQKTTNGDNVVEVGWTVDHVLNGGCTPTPACKDNPYLFGGFWKNGNFLGYNAATGYVDYPAGSGGTVNVGDSLAADIGLAKKFGIEHTGTGVTGAWWLAYGTNWVGYYPDSIWTGTTLGGAAVTGGFATTQFVQNFGEIAAASNTPSSVCTDMGTGVIGTAQGGPPTAGRWSGSVSVNGGVQTAANMTYTNQPSTIASQWAISPLAGSTKTAWLGGPGGC